MSQARSAARTALPAAERSSPPLVMEVDLQAISHNLSVVRARAARGRVLIAALKAGAYGHGAVEVARTVAAGGADLLATGSIGDARAIRAAGVPTPLVLFGASLPEAAVEAVREEFIPSVDRAEVVTAISEAAPAETPIFVKVDGGFGRLGVPLGEAHAFVSWAAAQPHIRVYGIHTHPTFQDSRGLAWARVRVREFEDLIDKLADDGIEVPVSQAVTSPGVVAGLTDRLSAVAVGHLLFGLSPVAADLAERFRAFDVRPALRAIRAQLVHVGPCPAGDTAAAYLRDGVVRTGVMPFGLWLGYRGQSGEGTAAVLVRGRRVPVLRVCLDNSVLDLSRVADAAVGDEVVVLGAQGEERITLEEVAAWQGAAPLTVLAGLGGRVPQRYSPADS